MADLNTSLAAIANTFLAELNTRLWWGNTGTDFFEGARVDDTTERRPYSVADIERLLNIWTWKELLIGGRHLFQNFPVITGAVKEKSSFVIGDGWVPVFTGEDEGWGNEAAEMMMDWMKVCDLRGQPYNFWYSLWIGSTAIDHDGDFVILHTLDDAGNPRLLFIEAHHIGQRFVGNRVPDGDYAGAKISNGVIFDKYGITPIAYRYMNDFWTNEVDIPAEYIAHVYEPVWFSQGRGIPSLSHSMSDWDSVKQIRDSEKLNVAAGSRINILDYDAAGRMDTGADYVKKGSDGRGGFRYKETITKGEIRHIQAGTGRKIESFVANRPGTNTMAFIEHMMKGGFMGMEWPMEFAYNLKGLTGPGMRALTGKVQKTVNRRQNVLKPHALRAYLYGLSVKMNKNKEIKFNKDWMKWDFLMPAEVSIDGGRDAAADLKEYEAGLSNGQIYCGRGGLKWRKVYEQRAIEAAFKKELAAKYKIDPSELGLVAAPPKGMDAPGENPPGDGAPPPDDAGTEEPPEAEEES